MHLLYEKVASFGGYEGCSSAKGGWKIVHDELGLAGDKAAAGAGLAAAPTQTAATSTRRSYEK